MKYLILIFILLAYSCETENENSFSLVGLNSDFDNYTKVYLEDIASEEVIDSAIVSDNSFQFKTSLKNAPFYAKVRTVNNSQYKSFWIEDKEIVLDASGGSLKEAKVLGSKLDSVSSAHNESIRKLSFYKRIDKKREFLETQPNTMFSAYLLSWNALHFGKETTVKIFDSFPDELKESVYGKKIQKYINLNVDPKIGDQYTNLNLKDTSGQIISLSESLNRVTLIEFWASWCGPCREENPNLKKTYDEYKSKGFEIYAVSVDQSEESWKEAINEDDLPWIHASDLLGRENEPSLIYGVRGVPDNVLINSNGEIVARNLRGEDLHKKVGKVLEETNSKP